MGDFTSIAFCYIECEDSACSNAVNACRSLQLCHGVLRSDIGHKITYPRLIFPLFLSLDSLTHSTAQYPGQHLGITGQLVKLAYFDESNNYDSKQQQQLSCFAHGRNVSRSDTGRKFKELNRNKNKMIGSYKITTHSPN